MVEGHGGAVMDSGGWRFRFVSEKSLSLDLSRKTTTAFGKILNAFDSPRGHETGSAYSGPHTVKSVP